MPMSEREWEALIAGLRAGDADAARRFCDRFGPALMRIANRRLPDAIRRRVGAEDVVQSACRTFLRRAHGGEFSLSDSEALWQLLCAITLTKVREHTRFHMRRKRSVTQEVVDLPEQLDDGEGESNLVSDAPDPADAAAFADQFAAILASLDGEERQLVDLKLQEYSNDQIAAQLRCSARTVTRLLKRIQTRLVDGIWGSR